MKKDYFHFALALVFLVIVVAGYVYWSNVLASAGNDVAALKAEAATANATVQELTANTTELSALSAKEAAVESYFVLDSNIVSFLENLQSLGTSLGSSVTVDSVSQAAEPRQHLNLMLHIDGPFDAVMRTMGAIEYAPIDVDVQSLTLGSNSSGPGGWSASMTLWIATASSSPIALPQTPEFVPATASTSNAAASSTATTTVTATTTP